MKFIIHRLDVKICLRYTALPPSFDEKVRVEGYVELDSGRVERGLLSRLSFKRASTKESESQSKKPFVLTLHRQSAQRDKCNTYKTYMKVRVLVVNCVINPLPALVSVFFYRDWHILKVFCHRGVLSCHFHLQFYSDPIHWISHGRRLMIHIVMTHTTGLSYPCHNVNFSD